MLTGWGRDLLGFEDLDEDNHFLEGEGAWAEMLLAARVAVAGGPSAVVAFAVARAIRRFRRGSRKAVQAAPATPETVLEDQAVVAHIIVRSDGAGVALRLQINNTAAPAIANEPQQQGQHVAAAEAAADVLCAADIASPSSSGGSEPAAGPEPTDARAEPRSAAADDTTRTPLESASPEAGPSSDGAAVASTAEDAGRGEEARDAPAPRRQGMHVTISEDMPAQDRKRPKEVIDVLREMMQQKRKAERLRRQQAEHRGLVRSVPEAPEDGEQSPRNSDTRDQALCASGSGGADAAALGDAGASGSGGGADAAGGSTGSSKEARRARRWRDMVNELHDLKKSNRAAEGEVSAVMEKMLAMNAELMAGWHDTMAEQMAAMTSKMEVLAQENTRLREEVASLKGGSTPTNGSELSHFKERLRQGPPGAPRGDGGSDASSLRSSVLAPPSQTGGGGIWVRGWGRSGRRAYSTADAYSLPPTPGGSVAGGPAMSTISGALPARGGRGAAPHPAHPVDLEALLDSFGTGPLGGGGGGGGGGRPSARGVPPLPVSARASDVAMLSPRSALTDAY